MATRMSESGNESAVGATTDGPTSPKSVRKRAIKKTAVRDASPGVASPKLQSSTGRKGVHFLTLTREEEGSRIISKYMGWGAGSGSIPFPFWDVAAIGTVQVMMVRDLLALYEKKFSDARIRSVVAILLGSLSPATLAGATAITLFRIVPVFGAVLAGVTMPLLASAATYAVGKTIQTHLAEGGDLATLDATSLGARVRGFYEEGKARALAVRDALIRPAPVANT